MKNETFTSEDKPLGPGRGIKMEVATVIQRPPAELFALWRDQELIGRILTHVEVVERIDGRRARWVAKALDTRVAWDVEIINEVENSLIGWKSLPGADVDCAGSVHFTPIEDGAATELRVVLRYDFPGAVLATALAAAFGEDPARQLAEDLVRLKEAVESGRVPTKDVVQGASEDSFPASDPPSWTAR